CLTRSRPDFVSRADEFSRAAPYYWRSPSVESDGAMMANYVIATGVRMWYDDRGTGDTVGLLHGGLTDSRDFAGNLDALADTFRLLLPERRGHGHTPDADLPRQASGHLRSCRVALRRARREHFRGALALSFTQPRAEERHPRKLVDRQVRLWLDEHP